MRINIPFQRETRAYLALNIRRVNPIWQNTHMSKQIGEWRGMTRRRYTILHSYTFVFTSPEHWIDIVSERFQTCSTLLLEFMLNLSYTNIKISFFETRQGASKIFDCDWKNVLDHNCKLADLKRHVDDQAPSVTGNANLCASRHSLATSWQENRMRPNARLCMQLPEERRCFSRRRSSKFQ